MGKTHKRLWDLNLTGWLALASITFAVSWYLDPSFFPLLGYAYVPILFAGFVWVGVLSRRVYLPIRLALLLVVAVVPFMVARPYFRWESAKADAIIDRLIASPSIGAFADPPLDIAPANIWSEFLHTCEQPVVDYVDHGPGHDYYLSCANGSRFVLMLYQHRPGRWAATVSAYGEPTV
jgi:hypothetical protein